MLYLAGLAAGARYDTVGGGVNYLCLPHDPSSFLPANEIQPQYPFHQGSVYGAEYQFTYGNVAEDDDVPCAVCFNDSRQNYMSAELDSSIQRFSDHE